MDHRNTTEFKVESGVPLPEIWWRTASTRSQMRRELEHLKLAIGADSDESFLVTSNKYALNLAKAIGMKIRTRKENGIGYRVWRIE